jgi:tRNA/rRNA methyltransferase
MNEYVFIMVRPARAEHLGTAARALKTMGHTQLRVVDSDVFTDPRARYTAHGSTDILDRAELYPDLEAAVEDLAVVVGTTARRRGFVEEYRTPGEVREYLNSGNGIPGRVGIVLGSEESGLSNHDLRCCDLVCSIPILREYPSLSLGQAVTILAWEFSGLKKETPGAQDDRPSTEPYTQTGNGTGVVRAVRQDVSRLLTVLGFPETSSFASRVISRLPYLSRDDAGLVRSVVRRTLTRLSGRNVPDNTNDATGTE